VSTALMELYLEVVNFTPQFGDVLPADIHLRPAYISTYLF
jgi:hypothetical protein